MEEKGVKEKKERKGVEKIKRDEQRFRKERNI